MNILILGGTGAMGAHLVNILSDMGIDSYVTSRRERQGSAHITYIKGNAHDDAFLKKILKQENWDAIVDFMVYNTATVSTRIGLFLDNCKQYVFLSSSRCYADPHGMAIKESSDRLVDVCKDKEYLSTDEYGLAKGREENIIMSQNKKNWTIIRPYVTYAENRLQLGDMEKEDWLYRAVHGRSIVFGEDMMDKLTTLTYGYDVAKGIASIIGKEAAYGKCFHITVNESHAWREILSTYVSTFKMVTGRDAKVKIIKKSPFYEKYQVRFDRIFDHKFDNSNISKFTDVNSFKPTIEGLEQCLTTFLKTSSFIVPNIDWDKQGWLDSLAGELTPLAEIPTRKGKLKYIAFRYFVNYRFIYRLKQLKDYYASTLYK